MANQELQATNIQQQALEALEKSTKMLIVASRLADQGKITEAERIRNEARLERDRSLWLMSHREGSSQGNRSAVKEFSRSNR
jgi:hypothetical protein